MWMKLVSNYKYLNKTTESEMSKTIINKFKIVENSTLMMLKKLKRTWNPSLISSLLDAIRYDVEWYHGHVKL